MLRSAYNGMRRLGGEPTCGAELLRPGMVRVLRGGRDGRMLRVIGKVT